MASLLKAAVKPLGWAFNVAEVVVRAPINFATKKHLSCLSSEARACAVVAAMCYDIPEERKRQVITHEGKTLILDDDFNHPLYVLCVDQGTGNPILGFTGTRIGTSHATTDFVTDAGVAITESKNIAAEMWIYEQVSKAAQKYTGKRLFVTGHSLGGVRGLAVAVGGNNSKEEMKVSHLIHEVHLFNSGSGLDPAPSLADEAPCIMSLRSGESGVRGGQRIHCDLNVHRIFGDLVSVTNFPCRFGGNWTITCYSKHPDANGVHSIYNFSLPPPGV